MKSEVFSESDTNPTLVSTGSTKNVTPGEMWVSGQLVGDPRLVLQRIVRHQDFWGQWQSKLREGLVHLIGLNMRLGLG